MHVEPPQPQNHHSSLMNAVHLKQFQHLSVVFLLHIKQEVRKCDLCLQEICLLSLQSLHKFWPTKQWKRTNEGVKSQPNFPCRVLIHLHKEKESSLFLGPELNTIIWLFEENHHIPVHITNEVFHFCLLIDPHQRKHWKQNPFPQNHKRQHFQICVCPSTL